MSSKRRSSRRDFLRGRSAREALDDLARRGALGAGREGSATAAGGSAAGQRSREASSYLFQISRRAMATLFQVYLNAGQNPRAPDTALQALDLVERLEDRLSIYRPHSEVSRINARAAEQPVPVAGDLFDLLALCLELSRETEGAFDITSTPLSRLWGFHDRAGRLPDPSDIRDVLERVGSGWLTLDRAERTVRFARPGMEINLGSIGKGFALDRCAEEFESEGIDDFLIHGGQSSVLARGSRLGVEQGGWWVALGHPFREGQRLGEIRLVDRALATSGSGNQYFHLRGRRYGHILDPRSGSPVEGLFSTTVITPSATWADALATALHVLGREAAEAYCARRPDLGIILAAPGRRAGGLELTVLGLNEEDWRPSVSQADSDP